MTTISTLTPVGCRVAPGTIRTGHTMELGGSARLLIPDNAKISVIKACLYDPHVNRSYAELAAHYGAAVLAARPYRPRDKAKVEACVGIVERWLLGRLRHRIWHGLDELNAAIADLLGCTTDELQGR